MSRRRGSIKTRSPGSFRLRYDRGRDPVTGKRRIATTTVRGTRKDAERELTRLLRAADAGEHVDPSRMTVRQWLKTWLDTVRSEISPKSYERYSEIVRCYLVPALGQFALTNLAPIQIQNAYSACATCGRRDGKAGAPSPLTRRYVHVLLKSALRRAVAQQSLVRNPAHAVHERPRKA